jgi:hypothetical protein
MPAFQDNFVLVILAVVILADDFGAKLCYVSDKGVGNAESTASLVAEILRVGDARIESSAASRDLSAALPTFQSARPSPLKSARKTLEGGPMTTRTQLLVGLFAGLLLTGCGPSAAEKRAQQVANAKDDALKLRQQLAQAKTGPEAENFRQQLLKGLAGAGLTVDAIHFTETELDGYVKAATAASAPPPAAKPAKAARQSKGRRAGKKKAR